MTEGSTLPKHLARWAGVAAAWGRGAWASTRCPPVRVVFVRVCGFGLRSRGGTTNGSNLDNDKQEQETPPFAVPLLHLNTAIGREGSNDRASRPRHVNKVAGIEGWGEVGDQY